MSLRLGFPDELVKTEAAPDHYATKVGGSPHVPETITEDCFKQAICGVCKTPMALIFQSHTPLSRNQTEREAKNRWLFLFACLQKGCGKQDSCWKSFRIQMDLPEPKDKRPTMESLFFTENGMSSANNSTVGFDFSGIQSALATMSVKSKSKKKHKKDKLPSKKIMCENQLPEFYLYAESEPAPIHIKEEDVHVLTALEHYKEQTTNYEESLTFQNKFSHDESYEKSTFKMSDGGAFWKFQKRLLLAPEQCARYAFKGESLLPVAKHLAKAPPVCEYCSRPRVFELQLMPHLMNAFVEAAEWIRADPGFRTSSEIERMNSLAETFATEQDWATVIVSTCSQSCMESSTVCYQESALVLKEPDQ